MALAQLHLVAGHISKIGGANLTIGLGRIGLGQLVVVMQTIGLAKHIEGLGNVVKRPYYPVVLTALARCGQSLLVVSKRLGIVAHIVVDIAKHRVEITVENGIVYLQGHLLGTLHGEHGLVGLLLMVEHDGMVQQGPCQSRFIVMTLIIISAELDKRRGFCGQSAAMQSLGIKQSEEGAIGVRERSIGPKRLKHDDYRIWMLYYYLLSLGNNAVVGLLLMRAAHNNEREYEKNDGYHFRRKVRGTVYLTRTF